MQPTAYSGDYIVATTILKDSILKNRLVIFFDEFHSYVIKRVLNIKKSFLTLKSDNSSTSSIFYDKKIHKNQVLFVVLLIVRKKKIKKL